MQHFLQLAKKLVYVFKMVLLKTRFRYKNMILFILVWKSFKFEKIEDSTLFTVSAVSATRRTAANKTFSGRSNITTFSILCSSNA